MDWSPVARILLRYIGGALLAKGILQNPAVLTDPDITTVICVVLGLASSALSELWYYLAKKYNWSV